MGVSATHLDWTMVPYVRKSFYKHFKDGWEYIEDDDNIDFSHPFDPEKSITDKYYNKPIWKKVYKYAYEMTQKEIKQACEGMIHNLNSLQSRSGRRIAA